jgi:hypothetical protein
VEIQDFTNTELVPEFPARLSLVTAAPPPPIVIGYVVFPETGLHCDKRAPPAPPPPPYSCTCIHHLRNN